MRLANGIVIEVEPTFGILKFSAMRRERRAVNEDGTMSEEITARTYDLKSQWYDSGNTSSRSGCKGFSVEYGS